MTKHHSRAIVVGLFTLALSAWAATAYPQTTFTGQGLVYAAHAGGRAVAVDGSGNAYYAEGSPAPDVTYPSGAYVTKLDADGRNVVYRTYLGHGTATSIAVDASGRSYVAGYANKGDFPTTNAYITPGTELAAFVVKLNADGTIAYSVQVGGNRTIASGVAVDSAGNAYVTGDALGAGFPTTEGAYQTTWHTGAGFGDTASDAFVVKLDSTGTLVYSTFLGGNDYDAAGGIAVDAEGNAYVTGRTGGDFPVTAGVFQPTPGSTWTRLDAFVTKLNAAGSAVIYSTYLGGTGSDFGDAIVLDSSADAYVVGETNSVDFPTTPGAAQTSSGGDESTPSVYDAFVAKLSASGATLMYGTYLGGAENDSAASVAVDGAGHAFVAGGTASAAFPVTARAFQASAQGGSDAFVTELDGAGAILYSTRLGGTANDAARGVALDAAGDVYITGLGSPPDFPYTPGAAVTVEYETNYSFAAKLIPRATLVQSASASSIESPGLNAAAAIDGNPATRWSSAFSGLQWITIDLGSRAAIDRVVLHWETAYATVYALEVSDDAIAWWTGFTTAAGDGGIDDIPFTTTARYVRMAGGLRATPWGFSLWEFDVLGTPSDVANLVPAVTITSPANGTVLTAPATFPIDVTAADADGSVTRVNFFVNGTFVDSDATAPFSFAPTLPAGTYTLRAEAYDNVGASASATVAIEVVPGVVPGTNLALVRPVVSSSNETPALGPGNAVDGNTGTRWSSGFSDNEWIYVDLGQRYRIGTVVLNWETAYASMFQLQVSDDGITWNTLYWGLDQTGGYQAISALTGTGRFVRMWGQQRATPWGFSLWEMEVYGTPVEEPLPPNIAAGKPTSASSVENSGLRPEAATDTLLNTRWSSAFADNQWIAVDLGANYSINRVILRWEAAYASHYVLQASNDASNWVTVRDVAGAGGVDDFADLAAAGRYLRMYGVTRATPWGFSLWEFEVYGAPAAMTANIAPTAIATSSSDEGPALRAANAIDSDLATRWSSAFADGESLAFDFGQLVTLHRLVLRWETAYAQNYRIQASDDGTTWEDAMIIVGSDGDVDDLSVNIVRHRYVRIVCDLRATGWGSSLWEVEAYEPLVHP